MKKYLLSTLMALGALGGLTVSTPAMAVTPDVEWALHNDPSMCVYGYNPNCNRGGYSSGSYSGGTRYIHYYLGLAIDGDNNPFFHRIAFKDGFAGIEWSEFNERTVLECNRRTSTQCRYSGVAVDGAGTCIAYLQTPNALYAYGGSARGCSDAIQVIKDDCMKEYNDKKICRGVKYKRAK